ncbi:MAG: hypothetical protein ACRCV9_19090 [Burkholderiaceae bacterium]
MRPDQLKRLEFLRDRLVDVAIIDADPDNWTAHGKKPAEMTKEERGDAKWCRGLAVQTVALTMQVQRMLENTSTGGAIVPSNPAPAMKDEAQELEEEIARYEAAASQAIDRASKITPAQRHYAKAKR